MTFKATWLLNVPIIALCEMGQVVDASLYQDPASLYDWRYSIGLGPSHIAGKGLR